MSTTADSFTPRQRVRGLMAAYACVIATTAALGLSLPLLPLGIERAGYSSTMNGLSGVMGALALLVTAPFIPAWAARFGTVRLLIGCFLLAAGCMALFPLSPIPLWYVLRFLMNAALQGLFIISEIWINTLATEKTRGRLIGLYGALATAGFAAGPAIAALFADGSMIPFFLATGVILAGLVPVLAARDLTPQPEHTPMSGLTAALIAAPVAVLAAFFHAGAETAIASFLPVYAVREGWSGPNAILLMTVFGLGNVILQLPIGWLADKINRYAVLAMCAGVGCVCGLMIPLTIHYPVGLALVTFLSGGAIIGMYTVGLTLVGQLFTGARLAPASAAFAATYALGSILGPGGAGLAMDLAGDAGLGWFVAGVCFVFAIAALRGRRA